MNETLRELLIQIIYIFLIAGVMLVVSRSSEKGGQFIKRHSSLCMTVLFLPIAIYYNNFTTIMFLVGMTLVKEFNNRRSKK